MAEQINTPIDPENSFANLEPTPTLVDRAINIYRATPWWSIFLGIGLIAGLIYMFGNEERRDTMAFLADQPSFTTDDKFEVTFEVNSDVFILHQTVLVSPPIGSRIEINEADVLSREDGRLACPDDAGDECIERSGTIVTYRTYDLGSNDTPEGTIAVQGVLQSLDNDMASILLPDGTTIQVTESQITAQEEGLLTCNYILDPACEMLSGEIVTVDRPYITAQAVEARKIHWSNF